MAGGRGGAREGFEACSATAHPVQAGVRARPAGRDAGVACGGGGGARCGFGTAPLAPAVEAPRPAPRPRSARAGAPTEPSGRPLAGNSPWPCADPNANPIPGTDVVGHACSGRPGRPSCAVRRMRRTCTHMHTAVHASVTAAAAASPATSPWVLMGRPCCCPAPCSCSPAPPEGVCWTTPRSSAGAAAGLGAGFTPACAGGAASCCAAAAAAALGAEAGPDPAPISGCIGPPAVPASTGTAGQQKSCEHCAPALGAGAPAEPPGAPAKLSENSVSQAGIAAGTSAELASGGANAVPEAQATPLMLTLSISSTSGAPAALRCTSGFEALPSRQMSAALPGASGAVPGRLATANCSGAAGVDRFRAEPPSTLCTAAAPRKSQATSHVCSGACAVNKPERLLFTE